MKKVSEWLKTWDNSALVLFISVIQKSQNYLKRFTRRNQNRIDQWTKPASPYSSKLQCIASSMHDQSKYWIVTYLEVKKMDERKVWRERKGEKEERKSNGSVKIGRKKVFGKCFVWCSFSLCLLEMECDEKY